MTSSARRALAILDVVNSSSDPLGVTVIAEAVDTLPGTAFRSLDALERCGYVSRYRASTQYQVGTAARRLKQTSYAQFGLRNIAMPFLRRLCYTSGDTLTLTVPVGWHALRLAAVIGNRPVRSATTMGVVGTLDQDFAGRAILAGQNSAWLDRFVTEAPPYGKARDANTLRADLSAITERGFSLGDDDGAHPVPVALPVKYRGTTIAAVALDGPVADRASGELPADFAHWEAIVRELEAFVDQFDAPPAHPFAHLDPAEVSRHLSLQPAQG